jgi:hypothetical protein
VYTPSVLSNFRAGWEGKIASILSLIEFDEVAPLEFISLCGNHLWQREERLMFGVLEDAVSCFQNYSRCQDITRKKLFAEAEQWLLDENVDWPFSFSNICDQIKLDKDVVRAGLLRWKHRLAATASELDGNSSDEKIARAAYQRRALKVGLGISAAKARAAG